MRVLLESLAPRVEYAEETDLCPQMFRVGCNLQQGLGASLKQQVVDDLLIVKREPRQIMR